MDVGESGAGRIQPEVDYGRAYVCLNVADINASVEFYTKLEFRQAGGDLGEGWAVLVNPSCELHLFQGHITGDLLNFRGGDVFAIEAQLTVRGFEFASAATVESDGSAGAILKDPASLEIYFNSTETEMQEYRQSSGHGAVKAPVSASYGSFVWALPVPDAAACVEFYERLGFHKCLADVNEHGKWYELEIPGTPELKLAVNEGISPGRMLMFHGGDVYAIEKRLTELGLVMDIPAQQGFDGVDSMMLRDPDGNMVCFHGPEPEDTDSGI